MKVAITAKRVVILMMTMALAVAMVACEAATSTPKPGEKGDTGDTGPAGPAGTSDNSPPMATMQLPMVYLALGGTGAMKMTEGLDLMKHFEDKENASLTYKFESDMMDVATAKLNAMGKMIVEGKKAGMATITVMAYDGVNADPGMGSFDVMVVADNAMPTVTPVVVADTDNATNTDGDKLGAKLYMSHGKSVVTVMSAIYEGLAVGVEDAVMFSAEMGKAGDAGDDIVSVFVEEGSKPDTWDVTLTPLKAGKQHVRITVKDKFGSPAATRLDFIALVNTPPKLAHPLPDKLLATDDDFAYTISSYFDMGEKAPTAGPLMTEDDPPVAETAPDAETVADVTCSYSTSPVQPTAAITVDDPLTAVTIDYGETSAGSYELTIACRDGEGMVAYDMAKITIRK